jgi:hypothetical protein
MHRLALYRLSSSFRSSVPKLISLLLVWALVFTSLPAVPGELAQLQPQVSSKLLSAAELGNSSILPLSAPLAGNALRASSGNVGRLMAAAAMLPAAMMQTSGGVNVFVGYADSSTPSANFPTPWEQSPNTIYLGGGSPVNAGAIRIDNTSGAPLSIDSVSVDLQRSNAQFNLWGSFIIPTGGSAILTQTQAGNFDTSAFPIVACGGTLAAGETRIPQITVSINGTPQTFMDTAHVLDTGGFDLSCRGNESLQWRPVGTVGIDHPYGTVTLTPSSATGSGGSPITLTAQVQDASGAALPNVAVGFQIVNGPNKGQTAQEISDSQGNANFTYTSANQGMDMVQASVLNKSGATVLSGEAEVNIVRRSKLVTKRLRESDLHWGHGRRVQRQRRTRGAPDGCQWSAGSRTFPDILVRRAKLHSNH